MPHTRRTLRLDVGKWDLMLDTDAFAPRRGGEIESAHVAGEGLSVPASALVQDGFVLDYPDLPLYVYYENPDDEHVNGPTSAFGTFTVRWMRSALFNYTVGIEWNSHGMALLEEEQAITVSVNGEAVVSEAYKFRTGVEERIGFSTVAANPDGAMSDSSVLSVSISATPVPDPPTGHIVVAEGAYATAQNVANECRVFEGDLAFERERGLPYYLITLGKKPSPSVLKARLRDAALLVEDVKEVKSVDIDSLDTETRTLSGEITVTSVEGENAKIGI